ncbi:unnamed protein product [Cuscuta epithymum]|uniref:Uncharacterized protein n=1 Tax=Cuscuta epithymum TaxID=186058 RepID=A0AAV0CHI6_9ASTE|nr:unnamed protein product [Cuscuta epithymum]
MTQHHRITSPDLLRSTFPSRLQILQRQFSLLMFSHRPIIDGGTGTMAGFQVSEGFRHGRLSSQLARRGCLQRNTEDSQSGKTFQDGVTSGRNSCSRPGPLLWIPASQPASGVFSHRG